MDEGKGSGCAFVVSVAMFIVSGVIVDGFVHWKSGQPFEHSPPLGLAVCLFGFGILSAIWSKP